MGLALAAGCKLATALQHSKSRSGHQSDAMHQLHLPILLPRPALSITLAGSRNACRRRRRHAWRRSASCASNRWVHSDVELSRQGGTAGYSWMNTSCASVVTLTAPPASRPPATLQEAVERRKAEMAKRDEEREKVKAALAAERAAANAEAQRQAQARIQAAQQANVAIIQVQRAWCSCLPSCRWWWQWKVMWFAMHVGLAGQQLNMHSDSHHCQPCARPPRRGSAMTTRSGSATTRSVAGRGSSSGSVRRRRSGQRRPARSSSGRRHTRRRSAARQLASQRLVAGRGWCWLGAGSLVQWGPELGCPSTGWHCALRLLRMSALCRSHTYCPFPPAALLQVLRKQREKDEELARAKAERDAEAARRALERKLQLQDKVGKEWGRKGWSGGCGLGGDADASCRQMSGHAAAVICTMCLPLNPR